jgi:hypothetical protein
VAPDVNPSQKNNECHASCLNESARIGAFYRELCCTLHRMSFLRLLAAALRLAVGDFAIELLLGGQRVLPRKARASGFVFLFATLPEALNGILDVRSTGQIPRALAAV